MFASIHTSALAVARVQSGGGRCNSLANPLANLLAKLICAQSLRAQRRQLAQLDATRLADLGISFDQAQQEAARPFWDVPGFWQR